MDHPNPLHTTRFVSACVLLFAGTLLIHAAGRPIADWDEIVYLHLSEQMTWTGGHYTTRGSFLEERLPQPVYRSPLFYHPPLVPFLIKVISIPLLPVGAARLMNALFYILLLSLAFAVARQLSDVLGGAIALGLVAFCPIFHLEARLIHLDLPMTVFFLLGICLCLPIHERPAGPARLAASGAAFAAGSLCKFTGPLFLAIPAFLYLSDRERRWRPLSALAFFGALSLGFAWWAYVAYRFGTLMPEAFLGGDAGSVKPFTEYLQWIARRRWYHLLLYFVAICPLTAFYAFEIPRLVRRAITRAAPDGSALVMLNVGAWLSVAAFGYVNAVGNGYWVFRHFLPAVAIVYVSLACVVSRRLQVATVWNSYLVALMMFTAFVMTWSTASSIDLPGNIEPVPVALVWIGLRNLFY